MNLFVMLNLGLGDAIICNGLVRELAKQYEKVYLPCYVHNEPSVKFMFSDLPGVEVQPILHATDIFNLELGHQMKGHEVLKLGMYTGEPAKGLESFDQTFYRQAGIPFSKRWDSFYVPESQRPMTGPHLPYALIFDDGMRGFDVEYSRINFSNPKIRPSKGQTIFDMVPLIFNAEEIHAIDSAPMHLIESIPTRGRLFFHLYARNAGPYHQAKKRKAWQVIT